MQNPWFILFALLNFKVVEIRCLSHSDIGIRQKYIHPRYIKNYQDYASNIVESDYKAIHQKAILKTADKTLGYLLNNDSHSQSY